MTSHSVPCGVRYRTLWTLCDPVTNWSAMTTGLFDINGAFRLTNSTDPAQPQRFYLLQLP